VVWDKFPPINVIAALPSTDRWSPWRHDGAIDSAAAATDRSLAAALLLLLLLLLPPLLEIAASE